MGNGASPLKPPPMLNEIKYLTINLISLQFRLERSWGFKG